MAQFPTNVPEKDEITDLEGTGQTKPAYNPDEIVSEVERDYEKWREERRPYEISWFITTAFIRGLHYVFWNEALQKLELKQLPSWRVKLAINLMLPKFKARQAKFLKNRFEPAVVPASNDTEDKLNADATKDALAYIFRKEKVERKYRGALNWANTCSKGFWWFYWDQTRPARIKDPETGKPIDVPNAGDITIDVGSPFEVFVADPGISTIGLQPKIIRARKVALSDIYARYPELQGKLKVTNDSSDAFNYQRQIANLNNRGIGESSHLGMSSSEKSDPDTKVIMKEHFTAPCGKYPKGRYVVVAEKQLLRYEEELPYEFYLDKNNPYPVVEFPDMEVAGQFWPPTLMEQLVPIQKELNLVRSKTAEQFRLTAHPTILAPMQIQFPDNAWTGEPGEVIRYITFPGIPGPEVVQPQQISNDAWQLLGAMKEEFDSVSNIFPVSQGNAGQATSGFQTNLLQEATDSVHAPDIRLHELAMEEACYKIRKMMAMGYDIPRLLSISSRNSLPKIIEFSQNQIDEAAEIVIWTGSALSSSPTVRTQQVLELWNASLLGNPQDPEAVRQVRKAMNLQGLGSLDEQENRDEEAALLENEMIRQQQPIQKPFPWENHKVHWTVHTDFLKSPEAKRLDPKLFHHLVEHLILTGKYINPAQAAELAMEMGRPDLAEAIMPQAQAQMQQQNTQPNPTNQPSVEQAQQVPPPQTNPQGSQ